VKNLFLIFVAITMVLLLKEVKKKEKLVILTVEKSQLIDFSGSVFLPVTIPTGEQKVKPKELELSIAGKVYRYREGLNGFYLIEPTEAFEVPIKSGDEIRITGTDSVKLFFEREE